MLKFIGLLVLLTVAFGSGYYVGQHPSSELRKTVSDLSRNVLDSTAGMERTLRARQGLTDAKSQVIQAKSALFDRNYGSAARALGEVAANLERARDAGALSGAPTDFNQLITKIRDTRQELASGKLVSRTRLDDIQKEVDALAAQ